MNDIQIIQRRLFDWRMNLSLALLLVVLLLVGGYINNVREMAVKDQQAAISGRQQATSNRQISALIAELGVERQVAAANQRVVLNYARHVSAQNAGLVAWLHRQHLRPPRRFVTVIPAPVLDSGSTSSSPTSTKGTKKAKRPPKR